MKFLKVLGIGALCIGLLSGCSDYSYTKAKPNDVKPIAISDTDARILLTTKVNDIIVSKSGVEKQILLYLEDSVTQTSDMKQSLIDSLTSQILTVDKLKSEIAVLHVSNNMKLKQKNAVDISSEMIATLQSMKENVQGNNFSKLKSNNVNLKNIIDRLQSVALQ